jgi:hypothetical protein
LQRGGAIPEDVYDTLVSEVDAALTTQAASDEMDSGQEVTGDMASVTEKDANAS